MVSRLFRIEWRKIRHNRTFLVLSILYFLAVGFSIRTIATLQFSVQSQNDQNSHNVDFSTYGIYQFPDIWQWISYVAGFFFIIPVVLVIVSVCNEYEFRTIRQNIIDGLTRQEFVLSKLLLVFFLGIASTLFVFTLVMSLGFAYSSVTDTSAVWSQAILMPGYLLQILVFLSLALFLAMLLRKAALTIVIFVVYTYVADPIISYKTPDDYKYLVPMSNARGIIQPPVGKILNTAMQQGLDTTHIIAAAVAMAVFIALSFLILNKKDI